MIATDLHHDTRIIADCLAATPHGALVTKGEISDAIGREIDHCVWLLYSAIRIVERENGAVFACVRGKGYRRLTAEELARIGQTARARIRGTARRGMKSMTAGVSAINDLAPDLMRKVLAEQSSLGLLEHIARDRNLPPINETMTRPLPVAVTAKEFLRSIKAIE
tara:strand:+ start:1030 stop:1524 length:495 start_codon:yes stop_codon:yes gene_type:complete